MREIKFRAWDGKTMLDWVSCKSHIAAILDMPSFILMQYTGLKDKNGREVYKGDVVRDHKHDLQCEIKWVDDFACFAGEIIDDVVKEQYLFYQLIDCPYLEVIGNIYENPELL